MRPDTAAVPAGWQAVRLGDVAEVNPRRPRLTVADDTQIPFIPMAALGENCAGILEREEREYREVQGGYTYFEENDLLFSKITPCVQNGKHALAREIKGGFGFGTTEFHVVRAGADNGSCEAPPPVPCNPPCDANAMCDTSDGSSATVAWPSAVIAKATTPTGSAPGSAPPARYASAAAAATRARYRASPAASATKNRTKNQRKPPPRLRRRGHRPYGPRR